MSRQVAQPFSIRMSPQTLERLDVGARRRGEAKARTAERLIDEGLRMAGGPDVWEVIETLKGTGLSGEQAIAATAEWGALTHAQVHAAVRYYADFREEVDERIAHNSNEADRQRAAWVRAQEALA